jgi:cytochrome c oxidase assembly protein subunit 15
MRRLAIAAALLALVVVVVGAYVRLSDAGLGCPDWPFCYGKPLPADIAHPDALAKAWKEMGHRYLASTLGILILLLCALAWRSRRARGLATALVLVVAFQGALGMWTVTLLLKPAIVTGHLIGGLTTLSLLLWLALSESSFASDGRTRSLQPLAAVTLGVVAVQVVLGGWVSANYAALACPDLPLCRGSLVPNMDFANAFHVVRELGQTAEGDLLSNEALTAIHWTHRMFALVALAMVLVMSWRTYRLLPRLGIALAVIVLGQFALGVSNVVFSLPLPVAAAHNAGAALLIATLVVINFFSSRGLRPSR